MASIITEELILGVLRRNGSNTIIEIAKEASMNRMTASKYLAALEAKGFVSCRRIGKAKLFSIREDVMR